MDNAGFRVLDPTGHRIGPGNGFGYRPRVGRGLQPSRGAGRHITTVDGHTCQDLDGPGCPASVRHIEGMDPGITIGVPRSSISSTAPLLAETTSGGTRWRLESDGTGTITVEETIAHI